MAKKLNEAGKLGALKAMMKCKEVRLGTEDTRKTIESRKHQVTHVFWKGLCDTTEEDGSEGTKESQEDPFKDSSTPENG